MSALATHLWTSTLVLVVALVLARLLPLTARTRYALLFAGLLKFAIPPALFAWPLRRLGVDRETAGTIMVEWVGGPAPLRDLAPQPASVWPQAILAAWIITAFALAAAWAIARRRLVQSALHAASPASAREQNALTAARRDLNLETGVEITRSTICEAPAVVRMIRPVVILPSSGCDTLTDEELESLLRHECAHVARRDNLLGLIESAIVAAFWFHPLVWIAQRAIATAREEACDETAAATADTVGTYVSALEKVCHSVLAARLAGVSCMASAHLKERLQHIMNFETLRKRALSHRFVVALAAMAILTTTVAGAVDPSSEPAEGPYTLSFTARPGDLPDQIEFTGRVREPETGLTLTRPHVSFVRGSAAQITTAVGGREIRIDVRNSGNNVVAVLRVLENGIPRHESTHSAELQPDGARNVSGRRYTGQKLNLELKGAKLPDALNMFADLTGLRMQYPPDLDGTVTVDYRDMPWDQALDTILRENRLTWRLEGDTMVITRQ